MATNWDREFPDFDDGWSCGLIQVLGFVDESWRNDVCPHFVRGEIEVWIDYKDPQLREFQGVGSRYTVHRVTQEARKVIFETDDWSQLVSFVS